MVSDQSDVEEFRGRSIALGAFLRWSRSNRHEFYCGIHPRRSERTIHPRWPRSRRSIPIPVRQRFAAVKAPVGSVHVLRQCRRTREVPRSLTGARDRCCLTLPAVADAGKRPGGTYFEAYKLPDRSYRKPSPHIGRRRRQCIPFLDRSAVPAACGIVKGIHTGTDAYKDRHRDNRNRNHDHGGGDRRGGGCTPPTEACLAVDWEPLTHWLTVTVVITGVKPAAIDPPAVRAAMNPAAVEKYRSVDRRRYSSGYERAVAGKLSPMSA